MPILTQLVTLVLGALVAVQWSPPVSPLPIRPATEEELRIARAQRHEAIAALPPDRLTGTSDDRALERGLDLQPVPKVFDFGEMTAGVRKTATIMLVNVGSEPIVITRAIPSMTGTVPPWPKSPIPPGQAAGMSVTLNPPLKQGIRLNKKITLQIEGCAPRVIEMVGFVEEHVRVRPDFIVAPEDPFMARRAATEHTAPRTVAIVALDGTAFRIRCVSGATALYSAQESAMQRITLGDYDACATGDVGTLSITTDHPRSKDELVLVVLE